MALGRFDVGLELLVAVLHLPEDTQVLGGAVDGQVLTLTVQHDDIRAGRGGAVAEVLPRHDQQGEFTGWGQ
jgi:hypothetical protein